MEEEKKRILGSAFIANNLIGKSACFQETIQRIKKISSFDVGVYIYGETGTGKELTARAVHYLSSRNNYPFIALSCGGLNDELILNELFGHVKGAYTGADTDQAGVIQLADKGTLFLDEIDSLSPKAQIALLRFLQEKEYKSLGNNATCKADTRIICASNRPLEQCVQKGSFRRDLLYRLDILRIDLPPLREREGDVRLLAHHFIRKFRHAFQLTEITLDVDTIEKIKAYRWPGNVRELENCMLKFCLLSELPEFATSKAPTGLQTKHDNGCTIGPIDIREDFNSAKVKAINSFEKQYLQALLIKTAGNVSLAARAAKKERSAFKRLLKKHGISRIDFTPVKRAEAKA